MSLASTWNLLERTLDSSDALINLFNFMAVREDCLLNQVTTSLVRYMLNIAIMFIYIYKVVKIL